MVRYGFGIKTGPEILSFFWLLISKSVSSESLDYKHHFWRSDRRIVTREHGLRILAKIFPEVTVAVLSVQGIRVVAAVSIGERGLAPLVGSPVAK